MLSKGGCDNERPDPKAFDPNLLNVVKCEASSSEEPSAVIPHAGICEGAVG